MSVSEYIKETQGELKRVSWPSRKQVVVSTLAIVVVSVSMALLLGVFDFIFSSTLGKILVNEGETGGVALPQPAPTSLAGDAVIPSGPTDANVVLPTLPNTGDLGDN
ncbi:MAG: hypothetical protein Greene101415_968 [Parcubacteria group bacterium Greene1014_15]|nr:MAG: hypothetical protein Greene101415_968 [Parcubacteria group bacterium Greene1014_15]